MIKTAVIGLGKMGISHCAIANANSNVKLVAICDNSPIVLEAFKKFNSAVKRYESSDELFSNEELDAIIVATPTKFHFDIVKKALEKGIHVFCEKPFTLNASQGDELVKIAREKRVVNQVGYHNHFIGTFVELKRLLQSNVLGDIYHFIGEAYGPVVTKEKTDTWRSKKEEGGGCLYDYASHVLNLIQEIVGKPKFVKGTQLKSIYSKGVEDAVYSTLILDSGISGCLSVNWSDETYRKMSTSVTVLGKKGKIICDATEIKIYLKEENTKENLQKGWTIKYITEFAIPVDFYLRGEEYSAQLESFFLKVIKDENVLVNSFESGAYTDSVIEMIINDAKY